jgi:hypothetical protein
MVRRSLQPCVFFVFALLWQARCFGESIVYVTEGCSKYKHPEIMFEVGEGVPEVDALHFKTTLEGMVASGSRFKAGQTLQLAWMILRFAEADKGRLSLQEPDLKGMPIQYVNGVTRALRFMRAQRDTADSFGLTEQMTLATLMDVILVPDDPDKIKIAQLHREAPEVPMSGWFLMEAGEDPPEFRPMSLYELALSRPNLVKFFALPAGTDVVIDSTGEISVFANSKPLTPEPGSFVAELNRVAAGNAK